MHKEKCERYFCAKQKIRGKIVNIYKIDWVKSVKTLI